MEEYDTNDKYKYLFDDRELDELSDEPIKELTEEEETTSK